jgi:hypothetical protein
MKSQVTRHGYFVLSNLILFDSHTHIFTHIYVHVYFFFFKHPYTQRQFSRQISNDSAYSETQDENPVKHVTYDHCVQEVMLRREGGKVEYMERLVHFVISRWRLPSTRYYCKE